MEFVLHLSLFIKFYKNIAKSTRSLGREGKIEERGMCDTSHSCMFKNSKIAWKYSFWSILILQTGDGDYCNIVRNLYHNVNTLTVTSSTRRWCLNFHRNPSPVVLRIHLLTSLRILIIFSAEGIISVSEIYYNSTIRREFLVALTLNWKIKRS